MLSCGDPSVDTLLNGGVAVGEWLHLDFDSLFGRDRCRRILAEFAHNALGQAVPVLVIDCGARLTEPQAVVCRPQGLSELRSVLSALTDSALQSTCVVVTDMDIALGSVIHLAPSRLASLDEQLYRLACSAGFLFTSSARFSRPVVDLSRVTVALSVTEAGSGQYLSVREACRLSEHSHVLICD